MRRCRSLSLPDPVINVVGDMVRRSSRSDLPVLPIFDDVVLSFFQALSEAILRLISSASSVPNALALWRLVSPPAR